MLIHDKKFQNRSWDLERFCREDKSEKLHGQGIELFIAVLNSASVQPQDRILSDRSRMTVKSGMWELGIL